MTAEELRRIAHQSPFRPFRVTLKSGEELEIKRTLRTLVADDLVVFGIHEDPATGVATRMRMVALKDILSVDMAEA